MKRNDVYIVCKPVSDTGLEHPFGIFEHFTAINEGNCQASLNENVNMVTRLIFDYSE